MNKVTVVQDTSSRRTRRTLGVIAPQGSVESRIASKFQDERMGGAVFTIDGITFGMEICLDHARPTATGGRMVEYANSIQILLIPSFGMEIMFHSCPVGGIIFNVDGHRQESKAVIKGAAGDPASTLATAPSTRGEIEVFGPFPIPRRAQVQTVSRGLEREERCNVAPFRPRRLRSAYLLQARTDSPCEVVQIKSSAAKCPLAPLTYCARKSQRLRRLDHQQPGWNLQPGRRGEGQAGVRSSASLRCLC